MCQSVTAVRAFPSLVREAAAPMAPALAQLLRKVFSQWLRGKPLRYSKTVKIGIFGELAVLLLKRRGGQRLPVWLPILSGTLDSPGALAVHPLGGEEVRQVRAEMAKKVETAHPDFLEVTLSMLAAAVVVAMGDFPQMVAMQ